MNKKKILIKTYKKLYKAFGPQYWWPTISKNKEIEIIIGAILTQNTSWNNVEKSISNLIKNKLIDIKKLREIEENKLAFLIRASGYFNQKAKKLKNFTNFIYENYNSDLNKLFSLNLKDLRNELLKINGVGEETADSIILYAASKPIFVIDAYTKRVMNRFGFRENNYDALQKLFMQNLELDTKLFNEYHALLVKLGKEICKKEPLCMKCPLNKDCKLELYQLRSKIPKN